VSETWYCVMGNSIEAVEVIKETKTQIEIQYLAVSCLAASCWRDPEPKLVTRRCAKRSDFVSYFRTWDEAHNFLTQRGLNRIEALRREMRDAQVCLDEIIKMEQP
jgi:hypothetical protein